MVTDKAAVPDSNVQNPAPPAAKSRCALGLSPAISSGGGLMRSLAAIVLVLLAACQSPTDTGADDADAEPSPDSEVTQYSELDYQYDDWLTATISERCGAEGLTSVDKTCAQQVLVAAFGAGESAEVNCPADVPVKDLAGCIIYGSIGQKLLARPGLDHMSFDWQAPLTSLRAIIESIADRGWMDCAGQDSTTGKTCYRLSLIRSLDLPDETICADAEESRLSYCIFEAMLRNELQEATLRTDAVL
jgi:hypothetical protein